MLSSNTMMILQLSKAALCRRTVQADTGGSQLHRVPNLRATGTSSVSPRFDRHCIAFSTHVDLVHLHLAIQNVMSAQLFKYDKEALSPQCTIGRTDVFSHECTGMYESSAQYEFLLRTVYVKDCAFTAVPGQGSLSAKVCKLGARPFPASNLQHVCREASLMYPRHQAC